LPSAYRWHPNQTEAAIADVYRDQRRKSAQYCASAGLIGNGPASQRPPRGLAELFAPNALGQLVIDEVRSRSFDRIQLNRCQLETHASLIEALIAVKACSDADSALPERLDDLVPRYLDALPLDHYDGAPLRYARGVPAVYSVGEDFADSGPAAVLSPSNPRAP